MLGFEAGRRRPALNDVETIHIGRAVEPALVCVILGEPVEAGLRGPGEEIGIEGKDYIGSVELVLRVKIVAEGCLGCGVGRVAVYRIVLNPLGIRERGLRLLPLRRQGRRSNGSAQEVKSG